MQTKLIAWRRYFGYSQEDMANYLGIDSRTYKNKERGHSQFKTNEMFAIDRKFNKKIDEIFLPTDFMEHEVVEEH